jgi:hypothetical protein
LNFLNILISRILEDYQLVSDYSISYLFLLGGI